MQLVLNCLGAFYSINTTIRGLKHPFADPAFRSLVRAHMQGKHFKQQKHPAHDRALRFMKWREGSHLLGAQPFSTYRAAGL